MTRAKDKIPFPMPISGVVSDQHPFAIGHGGLSLSQNWWNHDGIFRTRNGLLSLDPPKRWYEQLTVGQNLVPDGLAEGDSSGLALMDWGASTDVTTGTADSIAGDHQYTADEVSPSVPPAEVWTDTITAGPGLPYTAWVLSGSETIEGDIAMEFVDSDDAALESHNLTGDAILEGLWLVTAHSPPQTVGIKLRIFPTNGHDVIFGPMKIVQGEEIAVWSAGDGYAGTPDDSLFDIEVAHPETTQTAIAMWEGIEGRESPVSYQGGGVSGLFDGYTGMPFIGRALAYTAQPSHIIPSFDEFTGLVLKEDYRAAVSPSLYYKMSVSFFFDVENLPLWEILYEIEAVYYNAAGTELASVTIASSDITGTYQDLSVTTPRGRGEATFQPPGLTEKLGIRIRCMCPTSKREIVYDNDAHIVYDNDNQIVTVEEENNEARRVGIILDDVKLVLASGASVRWWDFELPVPTHSGVYEQGEIPLNYLPHDYLFEGATENNRIVMASDKSLWKWDDVADQWVWVGFDLATIYSQFYLATDNEDDEDDEILTLDDPARILFEETEPEGYTSDGTPDELEIQVKLPAAGAESTIPYPAGYWQYQVNDEGWSDPFSLGDDESEKEDLVLEAFIEFNGEALPIKIKLDIEERADFFDVCVIPEDYDEEDPFPDPIFKARIFTRRHDEQEDETLFNTDRDGPVDMRGYDYGQKTWIICANPNDRVTAWDGQPENKVERAGSNSPFASTICVSGGRVLAGNVRFDDPGQDLVAPLAVVYTDTFLSRGFRNWHPELAIRLADTPGEVVKLLEMGNLSVTAYKTDALYMLVYQTGNNPFRTQLMASNIPGPVSVRSVVSMTENTHMFLGMDGGLYIFDGSYPRNFSPNISRTIQSELDLNYKDRVFLAYTPRLNSALAMYPTKGSDGRVNRGMWIDIAQQAGWPFEWNGPLFDFTAGTPVRTIENYQMGGVTVRLGSVTSALAEGQSLQPDFFMGTTDGTTYVMDETAPDDWGEPVRALTRSGLTEFGMMDRYSLLKEMEFMVNRTNTPHTMDVEIWASDHGTDARPVSHETIDIFEEGPYFAEVREKARFWGYGLTIEASEQIRVSGAFGSIMGLGRRKS